MAQALLVYIFMDRDRKEKTKSKNLILVEDEASFTMVWDRLLSEIEGINYKIFLSPEAAIEVCKNKRIDILITDYKLPIMDGLKLIEELSPQNPQMKVVITSAYLEDYQPLVQLSQFIHIVKKPYGKIGHIQDLIRILIKDGNELAEIENHDPKGIFVWEI